MINLKLDKKTTAILENQVFAVVLMFLPKLNLKIIF
jgi:hypothetical protein